MNTITIYGQSYQYKLTGRLIKKFERSTGVSLLNLTQDDLSKCSFTQIAEFVALAIPGADMELIDDLDFKEILDLFKAIMSDDPKQNPPDTSTLSGEKHTEMGSHQINGIESMTPEQEISQRSSNITLSETDRDRQISLLEGD